MSDSITQRTLYYDSRGNQIRFYDWATVVTTLGNMAEPRSIINIRQSNGILNQKDQLAKVTQMQNVESNRLASILWYDKKIGRTLMGGNLVSKSEAY